MDTTNLMTICNDSPFEKRNVKLCKYLLGVQKKSTNNAVRGELGIFPILIQALKRAYHYSQRFRSLSIDSLLNLSCTDVEFYVLVKFDLV